MKWNEIKWNEMKNKIKKIVVAIRNEKLNKWRSVTTSWKNT